MIEILGHTIRNAIEENDLQGTLNTFEIQMKDLEQKVLDRDSANEKKNLKIENMHNELKNKNEEIKHLQLAKYKINKSNKTYERYANDVREKNLKLSTEVYNLSSNLKIKDTVICSYAKKLHKANSRVGGYSTNLKKAKKEKEILKEKISQLTKEKENLASQIKSEHIKLTPSQYDKRITTVKIHQYNQQRRKKYESS